MDSNQTPDQTPTPDTTPDSTPEAVANTPTTDTAATTDSAAPQTVFNTMPVTPPAANGAAAAAAPGAADPGKTLGIIGFVMSLLGFGLISLIMSIIAKSQSKKAGHSNGLALAGIIISAVSMVLGLILFVLLIMGAGAAVQYCQENPSASECTSDSSYESSTYPQ